ncbi:MAG: OadG family transporter subunit [Porphyromonas sp.]|nr:OadG family transporter subunit [Porphyromonas sp.]
MNSCKMNKLFIRRMLLLLCFISPVTIWAQSAKSLRLNEVLVINETNFVDDYGNRSAWIEIYNNSAGTVNIGGCFLTDEHSNPKKYPIPRGDVKTKIAPFQHTLFWADSSPEKGTFHVNFSLKADQPNYLALYDADGKTLIDEVVIPAGQKADISYGREIDGKIGWTELKKTTPDTNNVTLDSNTKVENLKVNDPYGVAIIVISMLVVFLALIVFFLVFRPVGKSFSRNQEGKRRDVKDMSDAGIKPASRRKGSDDAVYAAIAMAMYEHFESGYEKSGHITITPAKRAYSPWSSKIQTMRQYPR